MSLETPTTPILPNQDPRELFTVPADEFLTNYQPLTTEEMAKLGVTLPDDTSALPEDLIIRHNTFLQDTFTGWDKDTAPNAKLESSLLNPANQNWPTLETDIDPTKFGQYTLNPETQHLDFEHAKVFIPDLSAFEGKKLSEVAQHLINTYSDRYYLPGIEYWDWLYQNPDKSPAELKDGNYQFLFGSTLRDSNGHWIVPCVNWHGDKWYRYARWLDYTWYSNYRVALLER